MDEMDKKIGEAQRVLSELTEGMSNAQYREFLREMASWCKSMANADDVQG